MNEDMRMTDLGDVSVYEYGPMVMVELMGRNAGGEPVVLSYEFDVTGDDGTVLRPRGPLPGRHEATIGDTVAESGYVLDAT